jgi:hypothetical protein
MLPFLKNLVSVVLWRQLPQGTQGFAEGTHSIASAPGASEGQAIPSQCRQGSKD